MSEKSSIESSAGATARATGDRWELQLSVRAGSTQQEDASRRRTRAVANAQRVLGAHPGIRLSGEHVDVEASYDGARYTALWTGTLSAGTGDRELMREVVSRLAEVPDLVVTGPKWSLSPELAEETHQQALALATVSAKDRAGQIATALGGRLGTLIRAVDRGPAPAPREVRMVSAAVAADSADLPPRKLDLDLEPDECEVSAEVTLNFEFLA